MLLPDQLSWPTITAIVVLAAIILLGIHALSE
jgi:hypothetical protein